MLNIDRRGAVVIVIVWQLNLQPPVQSGHHFIEILICYCHGIANMAHLSLNNNHACPVIHCIFASNNSG